ncbi:ATP-binding protein [Streptomyces sp. NBC_00687]|uniref:ATP-binding protein n=1 Tax=Streptomyces sp. NBC_00687 TaxID=2975807 RepID=UPI00224FAAF3|nr:ATP-binding protein [Streptomyces sp. NBC_00687]MCX4919924.1 ATP-binding protein [Streptomyces sp. NBC_00687]
MTVALPENSLVVLIGASGAGKSTLASTWPASQVLSLDDLRGIVSDDPGEQNATAEAVDLLHRTLEYRMARTLTTVIDATNVEPQTREQLVKAAKRHGMPAVAVLVATPLDVCLERQNARTANRRVRNDVVRAQHQAMTAASQSLSTEGFDMIVPSDRLHRLEPFLARLSQNRDADHGRSGLEGLGDLFVARRFGPELLQLWRWRPGSTLVTGRDRVADVRLGEQHLTIAFRTDVDGDIGFDVLLPCRIEPECSGQVWAPVNSVSDLHKALTGAMDASTRVACTVHGDSGEDDPCGRADLEAQFADAVRD